METPSFSLMLHLVQIANTEISRQGKVSICIFEQDNDCII